MDGIQQDPLEGTSMLYSFNEAKAPERHETQYFEMFGNRGIYHKGWTAVTKHRTPWAPMNKPVPAFDDDVGNCTSRATGPRRMTSPRRIRRSCTNCSDSG